ncbi:MAG: class E sortase [Acidimicrobiales bacterium]
MIGVAPASEQVVKGGPGSRLRRSPMPGPVVVTLVAIMAFSVVAIFFGAYAFGLSTLQEQRSQEQLYASFRGLLDPSSPVAPSIGGVITPGSPVALINSPVAGMHNVVVVEGTSSGDLLNGPGHLRDSPLPGQAGESILMGRSTTAGAPFAGITSLRKGDTITVTTGQGTFRFIVEGERLGGDRLPEIPTSGALLTLVTSAGSGWLGRLAPTHLVYVDAELGGKAVAAPAGRPIAVPIQEIQGHGDPTSWPFIVLWAEALLAAGVLVAWLWSRLGLARTWLVGAPVLFGVLWGLSTEVMRLLPNVY